MDVRVPGVRPYCVLNNRAKVQSYLLERCSVDARGVCPHRIQNKRAKCALCFHGYERICHDILHSIMTGADLDCSLHIS